jgi:integrase
VATVRKRTLPSGLVRWRASYTDGAGVRRTKQFARKSDGDAWLVETCHNVARGTHTPGSISPTVKEAGALWIKRCKEKKLEATTIKGYEEHCELHLYPFIGVKKLSDLSVPAVNAFADQLRDAGRSAEMIKKVVRSLGAIFREARRRGLSNVAPTVGLELDLPERGDPRPVIPTKAELQVIIAGATALKSRLWRALVLVAVFCGLRASELRGLRWADVDFDGRTINVTQRADASHKIGKLKSKAAYRSLRLSPLVLNALREWKLLCPKRATGKKDASGEPVKVLDLVFPNGIGNVESYANLIDRGFGPIQIEAGVTIQKEARDAAGAPVLVTVAKYGLHALRHACASLWIEQGHNPKQIQTLMGHSSIKVTFDTYGHLFADSEADQRAAEGVELRLLGA